MLDNTIVLAVDHDRDATPTNENWERFEQYLNRTIYNGPNHVIGARNTLTLMRTAPSVSGNFRGTRKATLKFTKDAEVEGVDTTTTNVVPIIGSVAFSLPVGATAADVMHLRERIRTALDDQDFMTRFTEALEV